jgi:hypothetical protein
LIVRRLQVRILLEDLRGDFVVDVVAAGVRDLFERRHQRVEALQRQNLARNVDPDADVDSCVAVANVLEGVANPVVNVKVTVFGDFRRKNCVLLENQCHDPFFCIN